MVTKDKGLTYNSTLHAIKVLACFSVVAIHIWLPGKIGAFYQIIARFAVPMFFLIS
ncbi:TPA: acyltransferase, partial [Streptococcus pneumoniae]